jgi:hypothetical protein
LSIQILQYEFLGPISLDDWGPPMEKLVYLILSRDKDKFNILYVGDCDKTDDKSFFVQHSSFKCWLQHSGSEQSLFLAILPLFDSSDIYRKNILNKIMTHYKPPCNLDDLPQTNPDYVVRKPKEKNSESTFTCQCCGFVMKPEQILEKSTVFRCVNCGLSDTKLNC